MKNNESGSIDYLMYRSYIIIYINHKYKYIQIKNHIASTRMESLS